MSEVNGIDVGGLRDAVTKAADDPAAADRDPVVVARWMGGDASEVTFPSGDPVRIGGGRPNAMRLLLAALAACDIDLIATRAALLGLDIKSLTVEAAGHFNVSRYLGIEAGEGPGYQQIACAVRLRTRGGTPEQLAELRRACEQASPVADTLQRLVPLTIRFDAA
jgi:hypothetical protein